MTNSKKARKPISELGAETIQIALGLALSCGLGAGVVALADQMPETYATAGEDIHQTLASSASYTPIEGGSGPSAPESIPSAPEEVTLGECEEGEHTLGSWSIVVPADCTEEGTESRRCSKCSFIEYRSIDPTDHNYVETNVEDLGNGTERVTYTCTNNAAHTYQEVRISHVYGPASYTWSYADDGTPSSCTASRSCTDAGCGYSDTDTCTTLSVSVTKAATCTAAGTAIYTATFAKAWAAEQTTTTVLPIIDHDFSVTISEDVAATCTTGGTGAVVACSMCGLEQGGATSPALGHEWGSWMTTVTATCEHPGEKKHTCARCGAVETAEITQLAHDYSVTVSAEVAATCTADGKEAVFACSGCGQQIGGARIAQLGHNWGDWVVDVEATTEHDGSRHRTCGRCGTVENEVIPQITHIHDYTYSSSVVTEPTCTTTGVKKNICECGEYTTSTISALGHSMSSYTLDSGNCQTRSTIRYYCTRSGCSYYYDSTGSYGSHSLSWYSGSSATCTSGGWSSGYYCTVSGCGYDESTYISALGHNYSTLVSSGTSATCTTSGSYATYRCSRCSSTSGGGTIAALGHNLSTSTVYGKCSGSATVTSCSRCTYSTSSGTIYDTHDWVNQKIYTSNKDGATHQRSDKCSRCGSTRSVQKDCTWDDGQSFKNLKNGTHRRTWTCKYCDGTKTAIKDCTYTSSTTKAATCTASGTMKYTCKYCSYSYTKTIAKLGHNSVSFSKKAAGCTTYGYQAGTKCSRCGVTLSGGAQIARLGHIWKHAGCYPAFGTCQYKCSRCSKKATGNCGSQGGSKSVPGKYTTSYI